MGVVVVVLLLLLCWVVKEEDAVNGVVGGWIGDCCCCCCCGWCLFGNRTLVFELLLLVLSLPLSTAVDVGWIRSAVKDDMDDAVKHAWVCLKCDCWGFDFTLLVHDGMWKKGRRKVEWMGVVCIQMGWESVVKWMGMVGQVWIVAYLYMLLKGWACWVLRTCWAVMDGTVIQRG